MIELFKLIHQVIIKLSGMVYINDEFLPIIYLGIFSVNQVFFFQFTILKLNLLLNGKLESNSIYFKICQKISMFLCKLKNNKIYLNKKNCGGNYSPVKVDSLLSGNV